MTVNKGVDVFVYLGTAVVNALTNSSIALAINQMNATTQDSTGQWEVFINGFKNSTISCEAKDDESDTHAYDEIWALVVAGASVTFMIGKGIKTTGGRVIYGSANVSNLVLNNPYDELSGFTFDLQVTGQPTLATSTTTIA